RQRAQIVGLGEYLRIETELNVSLPIAAGQALAHARNVELTLEPRADSVDLYDIARNDAREALAPRPSAQTGQPHTHEAGVGPGLKLGFVNRAAMRDLVSLVAEDLGEIGGGDIAGLRGRRLAAVRFDRILLAGLPANRGDALALPAGVHFDVELKH